MKDKKEETIEKSDTKFYFYAAVVCAALGVISFGLAFTVLAIYALISSVLFEILAVGFCAMQKRKNRFPALKPLTVICHCLLAAVALFFIGGIIYTAI